MSLTIDHIPIVKVRVPTTEVQHRMYAILSGGSENTYTPLTTTNISASSFVFSIKPQPQFFVNKKIYMQVPVRIQLNSAGNGNNILRPGFDAPRAFPISQATSTCAMSFNGSQSSVDLGDYIGTLLRFLTPEQIMDHEYSLTPSQLDQSQVYNSLNGSIKSPFAFYGDAVGNHVGGRASFPFTVVLNTPTMAIIDMVCVEPIFLSPLAFGEGLSPAFFGIQNLDLQYNFIGNSYARMWSHDPLGNLAPALISSGAVAFNNFTTLYSTAFTYSIVGPQVLMQYITPDQIQQIPRTLTYPYFRVNRYPFDQSAIAPNVVTQLNSQNITLNSIPKKMFIFARNNNSILQNGLPGVNGTSFTDTYMAISNLSLNWNNKSGLLSQSSQFDLYLMAVDAGCQLSWESWSGGPVNASGSFAPGNQYGTVGSILCIQFAKDVCVNSAEAPGMTGNFNMQFQITVKNVNQLYDVTPTLYCVTVEEGTFTIRDGAGFFQVGILTAMDVLDAKESHSPYVSYEDYMNVSGGDFLSGLKSFGHKVWEGLKKAYEVGKKVYPYAKTAWDIGSKVLPILGLGEQDHYAGRIGGDLIGGELVGGNINTSEYIGGCEMCRGQGCKCCVTQGGKSISKKQLKNKLAQRIR